MKSDCCAPPNSTPTTKLTKGFEARHGARPQDPESEILVSSPQSWLQGFSDRFYFVVMGFFGFEQKIECANWRQTFHLACSQNRKIQKKGLFNASDIFFQNSKVFFHNALIILLITEELKAFCCILLVFAKKCFCPERMGAQIQKLCKYCECLRWKKF